MEKILRIGESIFKENENSLETFIGYQILTNKQTIKIGISDDQKCCEDFGYLITNDDIIDFIGVELYRMTVTDCSLHNKIIKELEFKEYGDAMFVNFETSIGTLQFVVYNAHNGRYGHNAVLIDKTFKIKKQL